MSYLLDVRIKSNMITVKLKNLTLRFCFGFFFVLAISTLDADSYAIWSLLFCLLHELGHLAMMLIFRIKISEMKFYGAGIKIASLGIDALQNYQKSLIYSGGCAVNAMLSVSLSLLGLYELAFINAVICAFNLFPISYFDGGRILSLIIDEKILKPLSCVFVLFVSMAMVYCLICSIWKCGLITIVCLIFILLCEMLE